jgi:hypothetical protein
MATTIDRSGVEQILRALEASAVGQAVRESIWLYPTIETLHVLALAITVGSIAIIDLRLLGFALRDRAVSELSAEILPWTWCGFAGAVATGFLLFTSAALRLFELSQFRFKIALIILAGTNMLLFRFFSYRQVQQWDQQLPAPFPARLAGAVSLSLWIGVVTLGRWIGFV